VGRILGQPLCRRHNRRSLSTLLRIAEGVSLPRLVSRREVRMWAHSGPQCVPEQGDCPRSCPRYQRCLASVQPSRTSTAGVSNPSARPWAEMEFVDKFGGWIASTARRSTPLVHGRLPGRARRCALRRNPAICGGGYPVYHQGGHAVSRRPGLAREPKTGDLVPRFRFSSTPRRITRVGLLGSELDLVWSRTAEGLTVKLLEKPPCDYAYVLKINPLGA
jgi:hypothetical protein